MDLVNLIAACVIAPKSLSPGFAPSVMQALIFEQSGGEPWSFSMSGEDFARVLPTLRDAVQEAQAVRAETGRIRVGLAGLSTTPQSVTAIMFAPCPNIRLAAGQISQLAERCKTASKRDPIYCAIAAYHGSWSRPETWFADAVRATVQKGNAPNFEMPDVGNLDTHDVSPSSKPFGSDAALTAIATTLNDHERAWSSALFPAKQMTAKETSTDVQDVDNPAEQLHSSRHAAAMLATNKRLGNSLFVRTSTRQKP